MVEIKSKQQDHDKLKHLYSILGTVTMLDHRIKLYQRTYQEQE